MKKNGFISTTLIYTFFIIFLTLMLFLLNSYSRNRYLLSTYTYDIKNSFNNNSNKDLNIILRVWNENNKEYELVEELEDIEYVLEEDISYCKNGSEIQYINKELKINTDKKDTCYIYFKPKEGKV